MMSWDTGQAAATTSSRARADETRGMDKGDSTHHHRVCTSMEREKSRVEGGGGK